MVMHARQNVYVLDVDPVGTTRMQAYSSRTVQGRDGDSFESVHHIPTTTALTLLKELTGAGILPLVLVLRWRSDGNHFQAVTYEEEKYKNYSRRQQELESLRIAILAKHQCKSPNMAQRDPEGLAKIAAKVLRELRKASKDWQDSMTLSIPTLLEREDGGEALKHNDTLTSMGTQGLIVLPEEAKGSHREVQHQQVTEIRMMGKSVCNGSTAQEEILESDKAHEICTDEQDKTGTTPRLWMRTQRQIKDKGTDMQNENTQTGAKAGATAQQQPGSGQAAENGVKSNQAYE
ncbi:hypothetical protein DVH05_016920 [Phytophthora capsici]|nr:hypothetical protein DVH05_016920 [Phytophthora capsici]